MCMVLVIAAGLGDGGRVKAYAVIVHADVHGVLLLPDADAHPAAVTLRLESVYDTVFYQRLNGQLRQVAAEQLVVLHIDGVLQLFLKAFLLQGEIVFYRIQFLLQGDNLLAVVNNACPQKLCQILHRGADGGLTATMQRTLISSRILKMKCG